MKNEQKIQKLKDYFAKREDIVMAFVFGSRRENRLHEHSDWDIAVYFKAKEYLELESRENYLNEDKIWSDLFDILQTNNVDFVVLNRVKSSLVYSVLRTGLLLCLKDEKLYFNLLCKTSYEAMDWWQFVDEYSEISEKAKSLTPEAKTQIREWLVFLEEQFQDLEQFKKLTWKVYIENRNERRNIERWIENLVVPALDIAKVFLASDKREIPQGYKEILKVFIALYIDSSFAERFSEFAKLRNIVAHEYLDIRWEKIQKFIKEAEKLYPEFIKKTKEFLKNG